jgi:Family of unknown function (DUF6317)
MGYSGYQVELSDLYAAGNDFRRYALEVKALMGDEELATPRGGNDEIDDAMAAALRAIRDVHLVIAQAVDSHGRKLLAAADTYKKADLLTQRPLTNLMSTTLTTGSIQPDAPYRRADVPSSNLDVPAARPATSDIGRSAIAGTISAVPSADKSWPPTCGWSMLGGQFHDMSNVAHELFTVSAGGHEIVIGLTGRVENLVGDTVRLEGESWSGQVAGEFSGAYDQDALNFYEFIRSCVSVGNIINGLACFLATKEAWLDGYVEEQIRASDGDVSVHSVPWGQLSGAAQADAGSLNIGPSEMLIGNAVLSSYSGANESGTPFGNIAEQAGSLRDAADKARKSAAVELLEICQALLAMLEWYGKHGGFYGPWDPGGLLTDRQEASLSGSPGQSGAVADVQSKLNAALRAAHPSAADLTHADSALLSTSGDLNSISGFAGALGDINTNIKELEDGGVLATAVRGGTIAGDLGTIGDIAAKVLPILVMVG